MTPYIREPERIQNGQYGPISDFTKAGGNLDEATVKAFGEEWERFGEFSDSEIQSIASEYFDVVPEKDYSGFRRALDLGCGSGRWSRYLATRVSELESVDPSAAVEVAQLNLKEFDHVRVTRSGLDDLPFPKESFDFALCLGVLHHMPNTAKAVGDLCQFIKPGGKLLLYLYYDVSHRGWGFRTLFKISHAIRARVSKLSKGTRNAVCDILAVFLYGPLVGIQKLLNRLGVGTSKWPLSYYVNKNWHVIRNDARDRFGTPLEQRFTREEITSMLDSAGMTDLIFSENAPFWHCYSTKS